MHFLLFAAMLAAPFWETKAPRDWNDEQLNELLHDSPWAQVTQFQRAAPLAVYLATAKPMREAEEESQRRYTAKLPPAKQPTDLGARNEYESFLEEKAGQVIVLGVLDPNLKALAEAEEVRRMEEECYLKIGRKKFKISGHFPPAGADPVLRLVFPRPEEAATAKELVFELYLPGTTGGYRQAAFRLKGMTYKGKLEM